MVIRRILAIGGGSFMMEGQRSPIDEQIVALAGQNCGGRKPHICLIPTPVGDAESIIMAFEDAYCGMAVTFQLTPFRRPRANSLPMRDIAQSLITMDAVFVSGGNTKSALGVWKQWGIDGALREAYNAGVLISGMSAGESAWFEYGFSDSYYDGYAPLPCLGWVKGGFCPHFNGENQLRAITLREAVTSGQMPTTIAVDDYAAVLLEDEAVTRVISWRDGCSAYRLSAHEEREIVVAS